MNLQEINDAIYALSTLSNNLEQTYIENEGEVTEETEQAELVIESLRLLLCTEGIDSLGRWMKSREDAINTKEAERDQLDREIKAIKKTFELIKFTSHKLLSAAKIDKCKGHFYGMTPYISETTSVDKAYLKELYQERVETVLRANGIIPDDVTVSLGASIKALPEDTVVLPEYYIKERKPTCKFTKPRARSKK